MRTWSFVRRVFPLVVVAGVASAAIVATPGQQSATGSGSSTVAQAKPAEPAELTETPIPTASDARADEDSDQGTDGDTGGSDERTPAPAPRLTKETDVFTLLGVTWDAAPDVQAPQVEVRWRSLKDGWSDWTELETAPAAPAGARPGTDPLWVGESDGVDVRVSPQSEATPTGVRVVTVTEGKDGDLAPVAGTVGQPRIISRGSWGASSGTSCSSPVYGSSMLGTTLHHTAGSNSYSKSQSAGIVRSTQAYHVKGQKWCDIGYNFLVDKYGQIFEGRKGGITKMVRGAHAGVNAANERTVGVSMMGNYDVASVPSAMKTAVADLIAWRHSLAGLPAKGTYSLGGKKVNRIMGHRDVKSTACPGRYGYAWLTQSGGLRDLVAKRIANGSEPAASSPTGLEAKATSDGSGLSFTWDAISGARRYHVKVSKSSTMSSPKYGRFTDTKGSITGLDPATTYYAAVALVDPDTNTLLSPYSSPIKVQTGTLPTITGFSSTGATETSLSFAWNAIDGVERYHVKISRKSDLSSPTFGKFDTNRGTVSGLAPNTRYYYAVVAVDPARNARLNEYTAAQSTTTSSSSIADLESTSATSTSMSFRWKAVAGAERYHVKLSTSPSLSSPRFGKFTTNSGTITGLKPSTKYYFAVVQVDPRTNTRIGSYTPAQSATTSSTSSSTARNTVSTPSSRTFTLSGHGYGHGIGMSQYGAQGQARDGRSWTQILSTYYPGTKRTTKSGNIRALITSDTTDSVLIDAASGITFRQGSRVVKLPTTVSGKKVERWNITPLSSNKKKSVLQYRVGGTYKTYKSLVWTGEAQFEASTLRLVTPAGTKTYRTALRSALPKSGATNRDTVNVLALDTYLRGVVPREMPASWHPEALKAQSVAARTYAVRSLNPSRYYDLCDTTSCQVYGGVASEASAATAAIKATDGTILTYDGKPALTQYSSSSGGYTNQGSQPYLKATNDPWDGWSGNANHAWKKSVTASTIEKKYSSIGTLRSMQVTKRNGNGSMGGRVSSLKLVGSKGTKTISGVDARWAFGLKSDWFGF